MRNFTKMTTEHSSYSGAENHKLDSSQKIEYYLLHSNLLGALHSEPALASSRRASISQIWRGGAFETMQQVDFACTSYRWSVTVKAQATQ